MVYLLRKEVSYHRPNSIVLQDQYARALWRGIADHIPEIDDVGLDIF